jgi:hypothetical protein
MSLRWKRASDTTRHYDRGAKWEAYGHETIGKIVLRKTHEGVHTGHGADVWNVTIGGRDLRSGPFRTLAAAKAEANRFNREFPARENPSAMDHVDNAVGHFVNEHPWISAMIGATALGAAGYVGVLITQAIIRQTPASSAITTDSDSSKGPTSTSSTSTSSPSTSTTSTSSTSTSSTPTYDASKAVPLYIQNAGKKVTVGTSLVVLDASTGLPVAAQVSGEAGVVEAGPTTGTFLAVGAGTVKIYDPVTGMGTVLVVSAASTAGVAISPRRPQPRIRGLTSLLFGPALAAGG